jgi:hypothetical protein
MRSTVIVRDREIAARTSPPGPALPEGPAADAEKRSVTVLRYLDVVLVLLAAVPAIALGAPALGYAIGAGGWLIQRVLEQRNRHWIAGRGVDARFGLNLVDGFGRIWLLAGAIVLAGVAGGRADGLTAALVIFCTYSIAFAMRVVQGRPGGSRP